MRKYSTWAQKRAKQIDLMCTEGVQAVMRSGTEPSPTVGIFSDSFPKWQAGKTYSLNEPFYYNGIVGFSRQSGLIASDVYPPFSTGTESLYGVRPVPDMAGIYPYVYNMAASVGMRVRENGDVYVCIQEINPMLYAPSALPAHFEQIETIIEEDFYDN